MKVNFWQCPKCKTIKITQIFDARDENRVLCPECSKAEKCKSCGQAHIKNRVEMKIIGGIISSDW